MQCDVAQCVGGCAEEICPGDVLAASSIKGSSRPGNKVEDGSMLAATTVFVLDPADAPCTFYYFVRVSSSTGNLIYLFLCHSDFTVLRRRYTAIVALVVMHNTRCTILDHVAHEHLLVYGDEL